MLIVTGRSSILNIGRLLTRRFGVKVNWLLFKGGPLTDKFRALGPVTIAEPGSREFTELLVDTLRSTA